MNCIKNCLLALAFTFLSTGAFAQFSVAGGLSFGTQIENIGIFARGAYDFTDVIRGNATINFFLGESAGEGGFSASTNLWTVNFDGHYLLVEEDAINVYALAGLNLSTIRVKFDDPTGIIGNFSESTTEIGFNAGGGIEFPLETLIPFAEVKYVISDFDQLVIMAGVRFPIGQ